MNINRQFSLGFCCAGCERLLSLAEQSGTQMLGAPLENCFGRALAHCFRDRLRGGFRQQCSEPQYQAREAAPRLLLFQLFESPKARFQHFGTSRKALPRPCTPCLLSHKCQQLLSQASATGVFPVRTQLGPQLLRNATVDSLAIHKLHCNINHLLPFAPIRPPRPQTPAATLASPPTVLDSPAHSPQLAVAATPPARFRPTAKSAPNS